MPLVRITDVKGTPQGITRLKANGDQMMLEEVAFELLVDVLREFGSVGNMAGNCVGRMMPDKDIEWWKDVFRSHLAARFIEADERG